MTDPPLDRTLELQQKLIKHPSASELAPILQQESHNSSSDTANPPQRVFPSPSISQRSSSSTPPTSHQSAENKPESSITGPPPKPRPVDDYGFYLPLFSPGTTVSVSTTPLPTTPISLANAKETAKLAQKRAARQNSVTSQPHSPTSSTPQQREQRRITHIKREKEWINLIADWDQNRQKKRDRIKTLCRYGIPDSLRAQAWMLLSDAPKDRKEGLYASLLSAPELPIFEQIEKDIHRCFPTHSMFVAGAIGQGALRNVLRAFAHYNKEIGYCQGMGMVAGVLLMRMPEEDTFWIFVAIIERYLEHLYSPGLEQLIIDAKVFEKLLPSVTRKVSQHLKKHEIDPLLVITPWFMTLFSTTLPWSTLLRLWDMFLCEGIKPMFRMALAIMKSCKDHLITQCTNVSDTLEFLLHIPHSFLGEDALVSLSLSLSLSRSQLDRYIDIYRKELRKG